MSKAKKKAPAAKSTPRQNSGIKAPAKGKIVKKAPVKKPAAKAPVKPIATKTAPKAVAKKPAAKIAAKPAQPIKSKPAPVAKAQKPKIPPQPEVKGRARLNKEELKYFERLLNDKKETLLQELGYLEDNTMRLNAKDGAGDLSSHAYHLADHATETQDREQAFHMASREGRYLFYLEEALDRVRAGTYGICKKCGKLIPKARLEAVPTAKMCIQCKSQQEQAAVVEVEAAAG